MSSESMPESKPIVTYSSLYKNFIDHKCDEMFKVHHSSVIVNMNALYIPMFQIMDIANETKLPCILKDIFSKTPVFESIQNAMSNGSDIEFNAMMDELQNDVDLILTEGFPAFETKITNLFTEIENEKNEFEALMNKISDCTKQMKELAAEATNLTTTTTTTNEND